MKKLPAKRILCISYKLTGENSGKLSGMKMVVIGRVDFLQWLQLRFAVFRQSHGHDGNAFNNVPAWHGRANESINIVSYGESAGGEALKIVRKTNKPDLETLKIGFMLIAMIHKSRVARMMAAIRMCRHRGLIPPHVAVAKSGKPFCFIMKPRLDFSRLDFSFAGRMNGQSQSDLFHFGT